MPSKPDRYRDLSVESRGAQDDTGSEASVPLMGRDDDGEKTFRANGRDRETRRNQFRSMLSSWRWLLDTALLLVIVGLLLDRRWQDPRHARFEGAGDLTGFAPRGTNYCPARTALECGSVANPLASSCPADHHVLAGLLVCARQRHRVLQPRGEEEVDRPGTEYVEAVRG